MCFLSSRSISQVIQFDRLRPSASASFFAFCFVSASILKLMTFCFGIDFACNYSGIVYTYCIYNVAQHFKRQSGESSRSKSGTAVPAANLVPHGACRRSDGGHCRRWDDVFTDLDSGAAHQSASTRCRSNSGRTVPTAPIASTAPRMLAAASPSASRAAALCGVSAAPLGRAGRSRSQPASPTVPTRGNAYRHAARW